VEQLPGEGPLGALLPEHLELLGRQLGLPFGVGLLDLLDLLDHVERG
jgi:hypothetical protein